MTPAERVAKSRANRKKLGLKPAEFWVTPEEHQELKKLYLRLIRRRKGELLPR
jgi:hypothetical protein